MYLGQIENETSQKYKKITKSLIFLYLKKGNLLWTCDHSLGARFVFIVWISSATVRQTMLRNNITN
jgi:hypothetical protein